MSRFDMIPEQRWPYLSKALQGLSQDLELVEAGGGAISAADFLETYETARDGNE